LSNNVRSIWRYTREELEGEALALFRDRVVIAIKIEMHGSRMKEMAMSLLIKQNRNEEIEYLAVAN
jgi:hypothetical protein